MKLRFARRAARDLSLIIGSIERESPAGADHVRKAFQRAFVLIVDHPKGAARVSDGLRVKILPDFPYKIFYRLSANYIDVIHIRHAARRPWSGG
jgi:toxin ParE1/3/4